MAVLVRGAVTKLSNGLIRGYRRDEESEGAAMRIETLIDVKDTTRAFGLSRQEIDALIREGKFPKPVTFIVCTSGLCSKGWRESDIYAWVLSHPDIARTILGKKGAA